MKAKKYLIVLLAAVALTAVSCEETPIYGDLDGMWQLMEEQTGESTVNRKDDRMYISFRRHLAQFDGHGQPRLYVGSYTYERDSIFFTTISYRSAQTVEAHDNVPLTDADISLMNDWGIYEVDPAFRVVSLSSSHLVLRSAYSELHFRKF